jgi:hypothetical protein
MRRTALVATLLVAGVGATTASAHNSAHFFVGDRCIQLGSQKEAPLVGAGNPNQNALGQLDLLYDPKGGVDTSDQYGARWAAEHSARLLPGDCPSP